LSIYSTASHCNRAWRSFRVALEDLQATPRVLSAVGVPQWLAPSGDVAARDAEGALRIREASLPVEFAERVARLTAATKESASPGSTWPETWMMRPRRGESRIIPL
jgi:hypothetical protein